MKKITFNIEITHSKGNIFYEYCQFKERYTGFFTCSAS